MAGWEQTIIIGNVGRDAELRYTPQGKAVANFSVAVTERWGSGDQKQEHTKWFRVTVWEKQAELANEYVKKGMQIQIVGSINASAYANKTTNEPTASLELTARSMQFLGSKSDTGGFMPQYDEHGFPIDGEPAAAAEPTVDF